jgi:hypothetical protein
LQALFPSIRILASGPLAVTSAAAEKVVDIIDVVAVALASSRLKAGDPKVIKYPSVSKHEVVSVGFPVLVYE